ncbi:MAG: Gfo/Idh/MocA family oxidoreductase [Roseicyclus sp.]|nr:Gfo/Idh/MocA family oxidoreductase [Roseicyclus sp.]
MTRTVLIAGFGAFGALHAQAWRDVPGMTLRVLDPDGAARARAAASGVPAGAIFADLEPALDRADIVDVVSPPATHMQVALAALDRGLPLLIEKPATPTVSEAQTLRAAAGQVPVQIGLILRAHPLSIRAREHLEKGDIGQLLSMSGDFSGWKRMCADCDLVANDGVHFLDLMRHFADSPIATVDGTSDARLGGTHADDIRIEVRHGNGIAGDLRLGLLRGAEVADSIVPGAVTRKELTLCGDRGMLHLDFNRNWLVHGTVTYSATAGGWRADPGKLTRVELPPVTPVSLLNASFQRFLSCVEDGQPPLCNLAEGAVELAQVCDAVALALSRGPRACIPVPAHDAKVMEGVT